jgi:hypothetical protein
MKTLYILQNTNFDLLIRSSEIRPSDPYSDRRKAKKKRTEERKKKRKNEREKERTKEKKRKAFKIFFF